MTTSILNLDDPSTWHDELLESLYSSSAWPILLADHQGSRTLCEQENVDPSEYASDPRIRDLQSCCENSIRKFYTHVTAYHACRTTDPNQYLEKGILTSSRERLEKMARNIFDDFDKENEILNYFCELYFEHYHGSVSLYTTARFAPTHYLSGCHFLDLVATRLGNDAVEKLKEENKKGYPFFIKCNLPISWLDDLSIVRKPELDQYTSSLIRKLIGMASTGCKHYADMSSHALVIFRPVGPECVVEILDPQKISHEFINMG